MFKYYVRLKSLLLIKAKVFVANIQKFDCDGDVYFYLYNWRLLLSINPTFELKRDFLKTNTVGQAHVEVNHILVINEILINDLLKK